MKLRLYTIIPFLTIFGLFILSPYVFAHGEELPLSSSGRKGPVVLSQAQEAMLQLKVAKVSIRPMADLLYLNGQVQLLPDAQADVSVRISGSVTEIEVNLGDWVKKGQRLAVIQSRLVGEPPPSVSVLAPMSGLIDARNINLGQSVDPNTVLFHISERKQLLIVAQAYEEDLGKIKLGQNVRIYALSYPDQLFNGRVTLVEPDLDPVTRTVNVRILLENTNNLLKPGMFVRAALILAENDKALTVPNASLLEAEGEQIVFVQNGHRYRRVEVHTGASDDQSTEITEGLKAGEKVVTQGVQQLYTLWLSGGSLEEDYH